MKHIGIYQMTVNIEMAQKCQIGPNVQNFRKDSQAIL